MPRFQLCNNWKSGNKLQQMAQFSPRPPLTRGELCHRFYTANGDTHAGSRRSAVVNIQQHLFFNGFRLCQIRQVR